MNIRGVGADTLKGVNLKISKINLKDGQIYQMPASPNPH